MASVCVVTVGLFLARIGEIDVAWSRALPSEPSSLTVVLDSAGRYFASFVVEAAVEPLPMRAEEVGIDLGLTTFAVMSDGQSVPNPRFLRRAQRKLVRLQRSLAMKQKGSMNRAKARLRVARAHARVADTRRDWLHKLSTTIIRENQAVFVEDLGVAGLARTKLAKSVHDAGWSAFIGMLEYKATLYGRDFARISPFVPTSQTCSACGTRDGRKPLSVRAWTCPRCGASHERDLNAAKNILAAGRADRQNACGATVRPEATPALRDEAGTSRGAA